MFLWQLFLVRLHLAQFLFPLSEQVNGHVPACPIFLLAHPANGRNARLSQCMVTIQPSMKFSGKRLSWWMTSPTQP